MAPAKRSNSSKDDKDAKKQKTGPVSSPVSAASTISSSASDLSTSLSPEGGFVVEGIDPIERVPEHGTRFGGVRALDGLPTCNLRDDFPYNGTEIDRLLRVGTNARGVNLEPMFNPDKTNISGRVSAYGSLSRRVIVDDPALPDIRDKHRPDASFSCVGRVIDVRNEPDDDVKALEISIALIHRLAPRFVAQVANLLSFDKPVFVLSNDGISFVTSVKGTNEAKYVKPAEMNSAKHGPSPRPHDEKIPVFDGRKSFQPTRYANLRALDGNLYPGDYVFLGFTLQGYVDKKSTPVQKVKLCIQFAVLLARPGGDQDSDGKGKVCDALADETPLGVVDVSPMAPLLPDYLPDDGEPPVLPDSEVF
ncbi:hypothetical protein CYLTODRAFT_424665 [Cylindrobasidium torrendii FP15055 ss-10]|uniref:Uncharacterized protein n=1 Tax=Cylindrobasidium torrendii FP15055 ss-10 TaxID=1314674 RepID=A0A0D7B382_9AGAR|nr:hypothetical protein CYLTODRAFT_424665 [Cylindrobasidium torrendii FP15055 ss-10]